MDIVIIGNSEYAQMIGDYIEEDERYDLVAYAVDSKYIKESEVKGISVISAENLEESFPPDRVKLVLAIGYSNRMDIRKEIYEQYVKRNYIFINYIHPTAIVDSKLNIGSGNIILEGVIIGKYVQIGNANLFFQGSVIAHNDQIQDYNTFASKAVLAGFVTVHNNNFIGLGAVISNNVHIDDYVFVGAGAHVDMELPSESVVLAPKNKVMLGRGSQIMWETF